MRTAYLSHPDCLRHDTGPGHPEAARRLAAIEDRLHVAGLFDFLRHYDCPHATGAQLSRVHDPAYLEQLASAAPQQGTARLDPDTVICPASLQAASRAAGAVVRAVDLVLTEDVDNAFCAIRPPGHHAESARAMGFCIYNNVAVGAAHAISEHGLDRVAIVDFDVHQGNGTEAIFKDDERVLFCSTFQHPFYPYSDLLDISEHMVSVPLRAGAGGADFRQAVNDHWLPALTRFEPQLIFVSAGFDAHRDDDMSGICLLDDDYRWITERILELSARFTSNRLVSVLEGGYELHSLSRCVEIHIRRLMGL